MTQRDAIFLYLQTNGSITPIDALMHFACFRLGARIYELRQQGHTIETEHITDDHGKTYARYRYRRPRQQHLRGP